ncbi:Asp23/Gls24 family envelope stress response protein [Priestia megaterium]|nr:Asp23/Gls24 family envelope stress response protein [Priestia megaterium]
MSLDFSNANGQIEVSEQAIATIVGASVSECYGVVGMASKKKVKDSVADLFGKDNHTKGIVIRTDDNHVTIQIHIIVLYGIKISEIANSIQEKVKYSIEQMLDLNVTEVNITVEDVRIEKDAK